MKLWKAGTADEPWKIIVCAHDIYRVEDIINGLTYILTDAGGDREKGMSILKEMSGKDIIEGLLAHRESTRKSVENGLKR